MQRSPLQGGEGQRGKIIAVLRKTKDSDYGVDFPDLPGCVSAGKTMNEAFEMAHEALEGHIELMEEKGYPIPKPSAFDEIKNNPEIFETGDAVMMFLVILPSRKPRAVQINVTIPEVAKMDKDFYNATVAMLGAEQQLIWSRYNAMLVANSIIGYFLLDKFEIGVNRQKDILILLGCVFGILLCFFWYWVNLIGWNWQNRCLNHGKNFGWDKENNPIYMVCKLFEEKQEVDWVYWIAQFVVLLFTAGYSFIFYFKISHSTIGVLLFIIFLVPCVCVLVKIAIAKQTLKKSFSGPFY